MIGTVSAFLSSIGINWVNLILESSIVIIFVSLFTSLFLVKKSNEYAIRKSFYENNISTIFKYYSIYYKYYRLCQQVTSADVIKDQNGNTISTRDNYKNDLNKILDNLSEIEGKLRLILPDKLLDVHQELLQKFNQFRDTMMSYSNPGEKPYGKLESEFKEIDKVKNTLEKLLKEYLRSEKVI